MSDVRRLIIVRRGDAELFEQLQRRYACEPDTLVVYDRRAGSRRRATQSPAASRRRIRRRFPDGAVILATRGYYVVRVHPKARSWPRPSSTPAT
jgi:hypothetical protein